MGAGTPAAKRVALEPIIDQTKLLGLLLGRQAC